MEVTELSQPFICFRKCSGPRPVCPPKCLRVASIPLPDRNLISSVGTIDIVSIDTSSSFARTDVSWIESTIDRAHAFSRLSISKAYFSVM